MRKGHWRITGYLDQEVVFERSVSGALSERQLEQILMRLACRHLSDSEVVSASLRKESQGPINHLDAHRMNGRRGFMIGHRGRYTARYEEAPRRAKVQKSTAPGIGDAADEGADRRDGGRRSLGALA